MKKEEIFKETDLEKPLNQRFYQIDERGTFFLKDWNAEKNIEQNEQTIKINKQTKVKVFKGKQQKSPSLKNFHTHQVKFKKRLSPILNTKTQPKHSNSLPKLQKLRIISGSKSLPKHQKKFQSFQPHQSSLKDAQRLLKIRQKLSLQNQLTKRIQIGLLKKIDQSIEKEVSRINNLENKSELIKYISTNEITKVKINFTGSIFKSLSDKDTIDIQSPFVCYRKLTQQSAENGFKLSSLPQLKKLKFQKIIQKQQTIEKIPYHSERDMFSNDVAHQQQGGHQLKQKQFRPKIKSIVMSQILDKYSTQAKKELIKLDNNQHCHLNRQQKPETYHQIENNPYEIHHKQSKLQSIKHFLENATQLQ